MNLKNIGVIILLLIPLTGAGTDWINGCDSKDGWGLTTPPTNTNSLWLTYNGEYYDAPASFWLYSQPTPSFGELQKISHIIDTPIPSEDGSYKSVLGFYVKAKNIGSASWLNALSGGLCVALRDSANNIIGGVLLTEEYTYLLDMTHGQNGYYTSLGLTRLDPIPLNQWVNIQAVYTPTQSELYINWKKVGGDEQTRLNQPPTKIEICCDAFNEPTDFLIDGVSVSTSLGSRPPWTLFMDLWGWITSNWLIALLIILLLLVVFGSDDIRK